LVLIFVIFPLLFNIFKPRGRGIFLASPHFSDDARGWTVVVRYPVGTGILLFSVTPTHVPFNGCRELLGCEMDDRGLIPDGGKGFAGHHHAQTCSGTYTQPPIECAVVPGVKATGT
jgi:hypothetical protein